MRSFRADPQTYAARQDAHNVLDMIWKQAPPERRDAARSAVYRWLSDKMHITRKACHIALFDISQCRQVIEYCRGRKLEDLWTYRALDRYLRVAK